MRVYLPTTLPGLESVLAAGEVGPAPLLGFAVTPTLREWYVEGDIEELEYAAMSAAARASLRLLAAQPSAPARRVVLAADVDDAAVAQQPDRERDHDHDRAAVAVAAPVPWRLVASVQADDTDAQGDVRTALASVAAADAGDEDAQFLVDGVQDHELLWYATQEAADLLG